MYIEKFEDKIDVLNNVLEIVFKESNIKYSPFVTEYYRSYDKKYYGAVKCIPKKNKNEKIAINEIKQLFVGDFNVVSRLYKRMNEYFSEEEIKKADRAYLKYMLMYNFDNYEEFCKSYITNELFKNKNQLKDLSLIDKKSITAEVKQNARNYLNELTKEICEDVFYYSFFGNDDITKTQKQFFQKNRKFIGQIINKKIGDRNYILFGEEIEFQPLDSKNLSQYQKLKKSVILDIDGKHRTLYNYVRDNSEAVVKMQKISKVDLDTVINIYKTYEKSNTKTKNIEKTAQM